MKRRQFLVILGAAAAWPTSAPAQSDRTRLIAVLTITRLPASVAALQTRLAALGWTEGKNIEIDHRPVPIERLGQHTRELLKRRPDVILARSSPEVAAARHETSSVPIIFAHTTDPVASGFVSNLARPGENVTGFMSFEHPIGGKWLELLREAVPSVARVGVVHNPDNPASSGFLRTMEDVARTLGLQLFALEIREAAHIEPVLTAFAREPNSGFVVLPDFLFVTFSAADEMSAVSAQFKSPGLYPFPGLVARGGLMSYSADTVDLWRRAADYIDVVLRGAKPGDLPVQAPTKFTLTINLKAARVLGLTVPPSMVARADEVIE